jgi:uncharacterized protein
MRKLSAAALILATLLGALFAWQEARPFAAAVDTRSATLICALLALLLAIPLRPRPRLAGLLAGGVLLVCAGIVYARYAAIAVTFHSDVALSGTLIRPRRIARPPVVVFVHGSGRETRREFRHYAQLLARHGIASLIYDKRGSGASGGSTWSVGYDGYARDAAAALRFVTTRPDVDGKRLALFGQSEGEWVVPLVLSQPGVPPVRAVVISSGAIMTPAEQVLYETGAQLRRAGYGAEVVQRAQDLQTRVLDYQRTARPSAGLAEDLRRVSTEPWFAIADLPDRLWPIEEYRWWRGVMDYDGRPHWRRITVPVLSLAGGRDPKSDVPRNQARLRTILAEGGNRQFTAHLFPRAEHGMIEWCLADRVPPPCWPHGLPDVLVSWLQTHLGPAG